RTLSSRRFRQLARGGQAGSHQKDATVLLARSRRLPPGFGQRLAIHALDEAAENPWATVAREKTPSRARGDVESAQARIVNRAVFRDDRLPETIDRRAPEEIVAAAPLLIEP